MFAYIRKIRRQSQMEKRREKDRPAPEDNRGIDPSLSISIAAFEEAFGASSDLVVRRIMVGNIPAALLYLEGLVERAVVNEHILAPLLREQREGSMMRSFHDYAEEVLTTGVFQRADTLHYALESATRGCVLLFAEGVPQALVISAQGGAFRAISEPDTEPVIRGPRDGFTELLDINVGLLRRRIRDPALRIEKLALGYRTNTAVCVAYLDGIANPALVDEVQERLRSIDTDAILSDGYIEEYIEEKPWSVFQTIGHTEKPDVVAGKLLEGRIAILVDGSPFALTAPKLFIESFQTAEDYGQPPYYATLLRVLRLISFFISLLAPALYVAFTTFHPELIPTTLLFTMKAASEGVPFPIFGETAVMLFSFEVLREAGIRLPKPVGQAISIVGALVMGQAAVQAGIVGAPVVIVIAFTAVTGFVSPMVNETTTILRWLYLILGAVMGGFGVTLGLMATLIHMCAIKSFSTPYLSPIAPLETGGLKDTIIRAPLWKMRTRPWSLKPQNSVRQSDHDVMDPKKEG